MKLQQLYSYTRRAIDTWQMIDEGDKIAIGVSGGKDSLTMLYALKGLQRFYPKHFELEAKLLTLVSVTSIWMPLKVYVMN